MLFRTSRWWARELARREQAWEAERSRLIDQILFLSGKPWGLPPRPEPPRRPEAEAEDDELELVT